MKKMASLIWARSLFFLVSSVVFTGCGVIWGGATAASSSPTGSTTIQYVSTLSSNIFRTLGSAQLTGSAEVTTYAGSGSTPSLPSNYNEAPNILTDDVGSNTPDFNPTCASDGSVCTLTISITAAQHGAFLDCGTTQTKISLRVTDCITKNGSLATWYGATNGIGGQSIWSLVTRSGAGHEVWQDHATSLLWSSRINPLNSSSSGDNWCRAAGNADSADPSGYCNGVTAQPSYPIAQSDCLESGSTIAVTGWCNSGVNATAASCAAASGTWTANTENWATGTYLPQKGGMGANSPILKVKWRLPNNDDFGQANIDGLRFVMPDLGGLGWNLSGDWTSTVGGGNSGSTVRGSAWAFNEINGALDGAYRLRNTATHVRCVGR